MGKRDIEITLRARDEASAVIRQSIQGITSSAYQQLNQFGRLMATATGAGGGAKLTPERWLANEKKAAAAQADAIRQANIAHNRVAMEQIEAARRAQREQLAAARRAEQQQAAADASGVSFAGGGKGFFGLRQGRRVARMAVGDTLGLISPQLGQAGAYGSMAMMSGASMGTAALVGGAALGVLTLAEMYQTAKRHAADLLETQLRHADAVRASQRAMRDLSAAPTTSLGTAYRAQAGQYRQHAEELERAGRKSAKEIGLIEAGGVLLQSIWRGGVAETDFGRKVRKDVAAARWAQGQAEARQEWISQETAVASGQRLAGYAADAEMVAAASMRDSPEKQRRVLELQQKAARKQFTDDWAERARQLGRDWHNPGGAEEAKRQYEQTMREWAALLALQQAQTTAQAHMWQQAQQDRTNAANLAIARGDPAARGLYGWRLRRSQLLADQGAEYGAARTNKATTEQDLRNMERRHKQQWQTFDQEQREQTRQETVKGQQARIRLEAVGFDERMQLLKLQQAEELRAVEGNEAAKTEVVQRHQNERDLLLRDARRASRGQWEDAEGMLLGAVLGGDARERAMLEYNQKRRRKQWEQNGGNMLALSAMEAIEKHQLDQRLNKPRYAAAEVARFTAGVIARPAGEQDPAKILAEIARKSGDANGILETMGRNLETFLGKIGAGVVLVPAELN